MIGFLGDKSIIDRGTVVYWNGKNRQVISSEMFLSSGNLTLHVGTARGFPTAEQATDIKRLVL